jgi:tetratricopeptide (TPR) repeat protein
MLRWRPLQTVVISLGLVCLSGALEGQQLGAPRAVTLRLIVSVDGDSEKAANVTVELMDAVGSGNVLDSKLTDNSGIVIFHTVDGLHRIRITGSHIQAYDGGVEIMRNETSHVERIRVRRAEGEQRSSETPQGGLVAAASLRVPASARKAFEKGSEAMRQQRWEQSRGLFETAIREYPQYDLAYNSLGIVQIQLNDVPAARQSFEKAISLNENSAGANRNLARILLAEQKNSEALPLLKHSLSTEPENAWALTHAAYVELMLHDFANALLDARKAHTVPHEGFANAHIVAAMALEATGKPAEAVQEYRMYLQEDPTGRDAERARKAITRLSASPPN